MATKTIQDSTLSAIADAIRQKTGNSSSMTPAEMAEEISNIQTGSAGRTTHYHGTVRFQNQTVYSMTIPAPDILASDMVYVMFYITKTGTVADGVVTWDEELTIPAAFNASGKRLTASGKATLNFGSVSIKSSDLATTYSGGYLGTGLCRQLYNKNAGNDVNLNISLNAGTSIVLAPSGYNGKLCGDGIATEYEWDIFILTESGNPVAIGG